MKLLRRCLVLCLVLLALAATIGLLMANGLMKSALERRLRNQTGMDARIGAFSLGLFPPVIAIADVTLYNTPEFGGAPFVKVPELRVEYDRHAFLAHKLQCKLVRLNLAELNLVQHQDGRTNIRALWDHQKSGGKTNASIWTAGTEYQFCGIDTLNLSLGKATLQRTGVFASTKVVQFGVQNRLIPGIKTEKDLQFQLFLALEEKGAIPLDFLSDAANIPTNQLK